MNDLEKKEYMKKYMKNYMKNYYEKNGDTIREKQRVYKRKLDKKRKVDNFIRKFNNFTIEDQELILKSIKK